MKYIKQFNENKLYCSCGEYIGGITSNDLCIGCVRKNRLASEGKFDCRICDEEKELDELNSDYNCCDGCVNYINFKGDER